MTQTPKLPSAARCELAAAIRRGCHADAALERAAQGGLGAVAHAFGDLCQAGFAGAQQGCSQLNAPLREVLNRRNADEMTKAFGQQRARHADLLGELVEAPGVG